MFLLAGVAGVALTGGVVSNAVEHLGAGSRHHVTGGAPGPAGADPIDGSLAVESGAWRRAGESGGGDDTNVRHTHSNTFPGWFGTTFSHGEILTKLQKTGGC